MVAPLISLLIAFAVFCAFGHTVGAIFARKVCVCVSLCAVVYAVRLSDFA